MRIIGVDCATVPGRVGIALGEWQPTGLRLIEAGTGDPVPEVVEWCAADGPTLLALDAPLGWPAALGDSLGPHRAGHPLGVHPDYLFRRETDRHIEERLRKRPLEVGANLIARTAAAALAMLETVAATRRIGIPLSWDGPFAEGVQAIEVYPAATLVAHGIKPQEYKKPGEVEGRRRLLRALVDGGLLPSSDQEPALLASADALDAAICIVAGVDYLSGRAVAPLDRELAEREGWIWAAEQTGAE